MCKMIKSYFVMRCSHAHSKGDDAVGRTRGRSDARGRTEGGGHRAVVTQGLEHEGSERRDGTWDMKREWEMKWEFARDV